MAEATTGSDGRPSTTTDEFYVGYLAMPAGHRAFLIGVFPGLIAMLLLASAVLAKFHSNPGPAVWSTASAIKFSGAIDDKPYPMFRTFAADGSIETYLLVEQGKFGGARTSASTGSAVEVSGWLLERDGRKMIELEPGDRGFRAFRHPADPKLRRPESRIGGVVILRGEIVDSKCYFGAMKPGEGKTHKECATLCIRGGIPPTFVTRNPAGGLDYYLLADQDGGPLDDRILPFVADPIVLTGITEQRHDLRILRIDPADIQRL